MGKTIEQIRLNETAEFSKTVSESDVYLYAGVTGDFNPAHINEEYARETFFKTRIAHGMLAAGLISTVLGTRLPGPGSVYVRQELNFLAPVRIGDTVTARVEVIEIMSEKKQLRLRTTCSSQDGTLVLDGEAIISPPRPKKAETAK
ncbi:MAG TPA: MaoC family dehydratase [Deltaproteobacteria bacterium]|nr:MaoC family dehydratase [Deltaproteobacteria bacterium]HIJ75574.1 MaoC family dehydratase [Deltaproteobacteria bacterium]